MSEWRTTSRWNYRFQSVPDWKKTIPSTSQYLRERIASMQHHSPNQVVNNSTGKITCLGRFRISPNKSWTSPQPFSFFTIRAILFLPPNRPSPPHSLSQKNQSYPYPYPTSSFSPHSLPQTQFQSTYFPIPSPILWLLYILADNPPTHRPAHFRHKPIIPYPTYTRLKPSANLFNQSHSKAQHQIPRQFPPNSSHRLHGLITPLSKTTFKSNTLSQKSCCSGPSWRHHEEIVMSIIFFITELY